MPTIHELEANKVLALEPAAHLGLLLSEWQTLETETIRVFQNTQKLSSFFSIYLQFSSLFVPTIMLGVYVDYLSKNFDF